jgi:hypothetical protein
MLVREGKAVKWVEWNHFTWRDFNLIRKFCAGEALKSFFAKFKWGKFLKEVDVITFACFLFMFWLCMFRVSFQIQLFPLPSKKFCEMAWETGLDWCELGFRFCAWIETEVVWSRNEVVFRLKEKVKPYIVLKTAVQSSVQSSEFWSNAFVANLHQMHSFELAILDRAISFKKAWDRCEIILTLLLSSLE